MMIEIHMSQLENLAFQCCKIGPQEARANIADFIDFIEILPVCNGEFHATVMGL